MTSTPTSNTGTPNKYQLPFLLALIVAGLVGNYFKYPIFLNIDFLFGSIFAMLALQFFGLGRGILAAAMIASYTYILWNHPYAIIIMTAEVAVVGWLMGRRKVGLVLADALYWLLVGMPLVYLFYHIVMHAPLSNAYITMTKQAVNGIANALVARLLYTGYALRSRSSLTPYREIIYNMLAFFVLCPALIMLSIGSRIDFSETDSHIRNKLTHDGQRLTRLAETWVTNRISSILYLAEMAASKSPQQMEPFLKQAKKSDANFQRVGLFDREATATAYYPLLDEQGQSNIGKNFKDRPYLPQLKQMLKPMLSEIVMARTGRQGPVVIALAPVITRGDYAGFVSGVLSLEEIREHIDKSTEETASLYTLLDNNGNIIMTNRPDQAVMAPFARGKGTLTSLGEGISLWVPVMPPNITISDRWRHSYYVSEATIGNLAEWKFVLEQPVAPFQKTLYDRYARQLTVLFLILIGALALAELISRRSTATLEKLRLITHNLSAKLANAGNESAWPESGVEETSSLITNVREMEAALSEQFAQLRQINKTLEQRVERRTRELHVESSRFKALLEKASDGIHILDADGNLVLCSPSFARMLGYTMEETAELNVTDWDIHTSGQELIHQVRSHITAPKVFETWHRRKDGSVFEVEINSCGIELDGHSLIYNSARDITKRKRTEHALQESEQNFRNFFESMTDLIWVGTSEGRILFTNSSASTTLGYTAEELANMHMLEVHPLDCRLEAEGIFAAMFRGECDSCPLPLTRKDGSLVPVETRAWFGHWNGVECIFGISKDLTAEQEANQRFERLFKNNPAPMALSDFAGRLVDVSDSFLAVTGYSRQEVIGKTSVELNLFINQEYKEILTSMLRAEGKLADCEMQVRSKDGAIHDGLFYGDILRSQGQKYLLTVMLDITARKKSEALLQESEERYRNFFASVESVKLIIDPADGAIMDANVAALEFYGYDLERLQSLFIYDINILPREEVLAELGKASKLEKGHFYFKHRMANGEVRDVEIHTGAIQHKGKRLLMSSIHDITEMRRLEQVKEDVEHILRHDLRAPLTGLINLPLMLMEDENLSPDQRKILHLVATAGRKLLSQINSSLELHKIESGAYSSNARECDPTQLLQDNIDVLAISKGTDPRLFVVREHTAGAGHSRLALQTDGLLLDVILMNLLRNALEASDPGAKVFVDLTEEGDNFVIAISNGRPVPLEIREHFFDKYATAGKVGGTGLGTYSAFIMTRALGGTIVMETSEESGTKVTVRIPIHAGQAE